MTTQTTHVHPLGRRRAAQDLLSGGAFLPLTHRSVVTHPCSIPQQRVLPHVVLTCIHSRVTTCGTHMHPLSRR
jgi:hypothetical protein